LNDCIYTGPSLTPGIFDILLRFRRNKVGLVVDIEKAFFNIAIDEKQRDLIRFLWLDDINSEDPIVDVYRFARAIFGMNCCPFLLNATLHHHVSEYYRKDLALAKALLDALCVDDWTSGEEGEGRAYELYRETNECFASGGFKLRKWASNNKAVIDKITQEREQREGVNRADIATKDDESDAKTTVGGLDEIDPTTEHKVLGLNWNLKNDTFILKLNKISNLGKSLEPTKRNVLKVAAKLFDPLGLFSPATVQLCMLLQDLCAKKYDWDSIISQSSAKTFRKWLDDAEKVDQIVIQRYYFQLRLRE
jgi:hypothetical protein